MSNAYKAITEGSIGAYITNPNLLDNPFFTVNQRGQSSYSGSGYTVDRWVNQSPCSVEVVGNGIKISTTGSNGYIYQILEDELSKILLGKKCMLSIILEDGTIGRKEITFPNAFPEDWAFVENYNLYNLYGIDITLQVQKYDSNNQFRINVFMNNTHESTYKIRAIKLELGSISTLANDIAPNYAEELAKCQRYCIVLPYILASWTGWHGVGEGANGLQGFLVTPVAMRTDPSLINDGITLSVWEGGTTVNVTSLSNPAIRGCGNILRFNVYTDVAVPVKTPAYLYMSNGSSNSKLIISADL